MWVRVCVGGVWCVGEGVCACKYVGVLTFEC